MLFHVVNEIQPLSYSVAYVANTCVFVPLQQEVERKVKYTTKDNFRISSKFFFARNIMGVHVHWKLPSNPNPGSMPSKLLRSFKKESCH